MQHVNRVAPSPAPQRRGRIAVLTKPTDLIRIRAFLTRICKEPSREHPWLAEFQRAILTDPDLDLALTDECEALAKRTLTAIVYRLFGSQPPTSLKSTLKMLGVTTVG
jgi:hypothetical protein